MPQSYTPAYYSTLHDSITSLCKTILPFSFKKRRLPSAEHKLQQMQSDNLKWQQDSFHQMLNLMGLHKEGILGESEVSAFRSHLLETLIAAPACHEHPTILRDKLLFLQELLYAKCITVDEYHSSKRPLLQRLAVQGAEIDARDVILAGPKDTKENSDEEWSVIDLKDENSTLNKENLQSKSKLKQNSTMKHIKGAVSALSFGSSYKPSKSKAEISIFDTFSQNLSSSNFDMTSSNNEKPFWDGRLKEKETETQSILMAESLPQESLKESGASSKQKRKPFRTIFQKEQREGHGGDNNNGPESEERSSKSAKKQWGFEGLKKWKKHDSDDETAPLSLNERSYSEAYACIGEGPDTKQIKRKLLSDGSPSDFFIDKVLGDKIKKELSRIQTELGTTNPKMKFSDEQIEAISTKLPVDKADLKKFFPRSWCDQYGDMVLDVVKKEFKDHVGEMEKLRNAARERHNHSARWTTFDDDENCHPNLFAANKDYSLPQKQPFDSSCFEENPFFQNYAEGYGRKY
ncbi:uncharacterized protein LOC115690787 [Syzygium oleosum]|uniref:uncharacterized protein LOC115690787 n=1 Tax=Syzygium oleosum TaxID=219896 RepID=UPI0024BAB8B8|nr:uncharacterized protein LOC115690787 [Syzygium oleosum]